MAAAPLAPGGYLPADSPIHRLDPRTKLAALFLIGASSLSFASWKSLALLAAVSLAGCAAAGVGPGMLLRSLRNFLWLFLFTAILQVFWTAGTPLVSLAAGRWSLEITSEGLARGALLFLRLFTLIIAATLTAATTSPGGLGAGLAKLLAPLRRLGLPVEETVLAFSIGMQFLPILSREAEDIKNSQIARGIGHLAANPFARLACLPALFVPVLARAMRRADELSLAMISRGYREGARRTALHPLRLGRSDAAAAGALALLLAAAFLAGK